MALADLRFTVPVFSRIAFIILIAFIVILIAFIVILNEVKEPPRL